jgi:cell division protein FtsQ
VTTILDEPSPPHVSESTAEDAAPAQPEPASTVRELRRARRARKRYERGEVKRFTKRARRRRAVWLISLGSVALILLLAVAAAFSPLMAVTKIDVVGTSRLKPATIAHALDGQLGRPLPLIDFASIKKQLAGFALIRSYSTETHPPGTLVVRIVERQPIGLIETSKGFELVDAAGVAISTSKDRPGGYPVVTQNGAAGSAAAKAGFAASAAVLSALPASVLSQVSSVTAKTTDDVTLTLQSGQKVLWGSPDQSDLKAADLAALLKDAPDASGYDVSSPQSPVTQ